MKSILNKSLFSKLSWTGVLLSLCIFMINFLLGFTTLNAQVNYVQNPSFEELYHCPTYTSIIDSVVNWGHLKTGGGGEPGVFNLCNNLLIPIYGVPNNGYSGYSTYQYPVNGNGYTGIVLLWHDTLMPQNFIRFYLQNELRTRLSAGKQYCIKIHVSRTNDCTSAIDRIGFYFDDGMVESQGQSGLIADTPDVELFLNNGGYLQDTLNWMVLEGTFTANGEESYMTIGNFHDNENTDYINLAPSVNNLFVAMYYLDDVSVIESDLPAWAGNDTIINVGDSVFIGRPPEIGLECTWYDIQGDSIGTGAGMWVSPVVPTSYIVEQVLCGGVKRDTVTVYAYPTGIPVTALNEAVRVYPNPASEVLTVEILPGNSAGLILWNALGQVVLQSAILQSGKTQIHLRGIPDGIYFYEVMDDKKVGSYGKVVIQRE